MGNVRLSNISKVYGKGESSVKAVDDISFSINDGEFVCILGASGAGKSTLLNILGGMDRISSGDFIIDETNIGELNDKQLGVYRRKEIGFVFQFYNLMPNLTALENIVLSETLSDNPLDSKEILKLVGLENRSNNFPSELSGGEQQRVAIARAIVKNPTLLLCDEPTGALDSKTGAKILKLLKDINQEYNKTVIIVTHNSKIASVCSRVITLADGKILSDEQNKTEMDVEEIVW